MIGRLTQVEQEELLRRYFSGTMSASEESDFFVQVALDSTLRRMLKAHSLVRDTLEEKRSTPPLDHHSGRARLVASLAALHGAPAAVVAPPERSRPGRSRLLFAGTVGLVLAVGLGIFVDRLLPSPSPVAGIMPSTLRTVLHQQSRLGAAAAIEFFCRSDSVQGAGGATKLPLPLASRSGAPLPTAAVRSAITKTPVDSSASRSLPKLVELSPPPPLSAKGVRSIEASTADTVHFKSPDTVTLRLRVKRSKD